MPLEAHDPRWIELLQDASRQEMEIPVDDISQGVNLRQKLYTVRSEMQKAKHPAYLATTRVKISIMFLPSGAAKPISFVSRKTTPVPDGEVKCYLRLVPDKYSDILDKKGYKIPEEPEL
jgi:hypothetical protein